MSADAQPSWEIVKRLLLQTLEQPVESRAAFLATACGGDKALHAEVESLLAHHDQADHAAFLEARQPPLAIGTSFPDSPLCAVGADVNLLVGIVALQNHFITREALVAGFAMWVQDKSRTLAGIIQSQGALSGEDREILDRLMAKILEKHEGDVERSLAAVGSGGEVRLDLERLNDPDLATTLSTVAHVKAAGPPPVGGSSLGRFRILRAHAKGGLGLVSVALDEELHREVALKEIQARFADDAQTRSRFMLEAEIAGCLEHPGIVPIYGLGQTTDGRPFYAMRLIKGDSLKAAIDRFHDADAAPRDPGQRRLEFRELLGRFVAVCNAVAYAHSRGVLHRDLKPANVMLGNYGETLVVDWGLAKASGKQAGESTEVTLRPATASGGSFETLPGSVIGTPQYMSPEQAAGRLDELGPASDIYSLGATLYQILTGKTPFEGAGRIEIVQRIQHSDFPPPHAVKRVAPRALEAVCLKAMARLPADRYVSTRELGNEIERWLADEPVRAAPRRVLESAIRHIRRHPLFTGILVFCMMVDLPFAVSTAARTESSQSSVVAKLLDPASFGTTTAFFNAAILLAGILLQGGIVGGAMLGAAIAVTAGGYGPLFSRWSVRAIITRARAGAATGARAGCIAGVGCAIALYAWMFTNSSTVFGVAWAFVSTVTFAVAAVEVNAHHANDIDYKPGKTSASFLADFFMLGMPSIIYREVRESHIDFETAVGIAVRKTLTLLRSLVALSLVILAIGIVVYVIFELVL